MFYGEDAGREGVYRVQEKSEGAFRLARRKSTLGRLGRKLERWFSGVDLCCEGCCEFLLCFEEERGRGRSGEKQSTNASLEVGGRRRSFETVEVDEVVGSVGRCRSFDAGFLPVCSCSAERWKSVDRAMREGRSLPPIELYKLGEKYFVVDGNHRVSVARYRGIPALEALVTELTGPRQEAR